MMNSTTRHQITQLIKKEVIPAIGCTEPIAVSLCVAKATELLGKQPEKIKLLLSANILKNAMGVGIPGTGMIGLPIAIALGALIGKSEKQLEVLADTTPEAVEQGKQYIQEGRISIGLKDTDEKLYIETTVTEGNNSATAVIALNHTNFTYLSTNEEVILNTPLGKSACKEADEFQLTMANVWEFATTTPLEEIRFILDSAKLNKAAAENSFKGNYGHGLGRLLKEHSKYDIFGDTTFKHILSYTSAACDARMAGAMFPVMSNSGSGNQGISATLPVVVFAEDKQCNEEQLIRALTLSHLTVIYIKQSLGRLSALCGCVVAATGSSCGITYLMGGGLNEVSSAVKNMVANLTGMICDGAKPSCALKVTSGISTAVLSAMLAMEQKCVTSVEGIIDDSVDITIQNMTTIGKEGMNETDRLVLKIMTDKQQ